MSDTPAERADARTEIARLTAQLRESDTPEGHTFRTARIAALNQLVSIAHAPEPAPPATGLPLTARLALRDERRRLNRELDDIPEGHPDRQLILDRQLETHREEIEAAARPTGMIDLVPAEVRGEAWAPELLSAARSLGLETAVPSLLHVAVSELHTGRTGWSDEDATRELVFRHGEAKADEIVADAQAAARNLPAAFRGWLAEKRLISNPSLVEEVARVWRRRGVARSVPRAGVAAFR
jgi:hypothetical protein